VRSEPDPSKMNRLMAYVLMWRKEQGDASGWSRERRAARWREWVQERQEFRAIALDVHSRMRQIIAEAEDRARKAEAGFSQLQDAADLLRELGVEPGYSRWETRRRIEAVLLDANAIESVRAARKALERVEGLLTPQASEGAMTA